MEFKDLASNGLALLALVFSIYATIKSERNSREERKRTIRGQLTDVLGKLTSLNIDGAKLIHDARGDTRYAEFIGSALSQQNGFLLDQADFLSEQIPALVTTYEFNTIALACVNAGDTMRADKYHRRAVAVAPPGLYKAQATRSYASFLFGQGRLKEGREHFQSALKLMKGTDSLAHWTNGTTYQWWARVEQQFARTPDVAQEYVALARKEFAAIDNDLVRNNALNQLAGDNLLPPTQSAAPAAEPSMPPIVPRPPGPSGWA